MSMTENGKSFSVDFSGVVQEGEEIGAMVVRGGEIGLTLRSQIRTSIERLAVTGERNKEERPGITASLAAKGVMTLSLSHLGYEVVILYDNDQDLSPVRVTRGEEADLQSHTEPVTRFQVEGRKNGKTTGWLITLPNELSGIGKMVYSFAASVRERGIDQVGYTTLGTAHHVPLFRKKEGRRELSIVERTFMGKNWKIVSGGVKTYASKAEGDWMIFPFEASTIALIILGKAPKCTFYGNTDFMGAPVNPSEISRLSFHIHL